MVIYKIELTWFFFANEIHDFKNLVQYSSKIIALYIIQLTCIRGNFCTHFISLFLFLTSILCCEIPSTVKHETELLLTLKSLTLRRKQKNIYIQSIKFYYNLI